MVKVAFDHSELEVLTTLLRESVEATHRVGYDVPLSAGTALQKLAVAHSLLCPTHKRNGTAEQSEAWVRDYASTLLERFEL